ncbi:hypothetical protein [Dactylosporangium sp. CA-233914]|uniref:hypothetical protein n=1 Tax=Dactylosporangium sp. CA-233914 TaxID=3239934 RepID=UPI003D910A81
MSLTLLLLRRHRLVLGSWLVLLVGLCASTVQAYQDSYSTAEQRRTAVELAHHNTATTLLYGRLPDPGTPGQMYAWEIGAIVTILAGVMAVLVTVSVTRAIEDDGTLELLRCCGLPPRLPLTSALTLLGMLGTVLALGTAAAAGLWTGRVDGVTWPGAAAFGASVGLTFLLMAALTTVLAQVAPAAGQARTVAFAALGVAFGLRAFADTQDVGALNWFSPLALRATAQPFTGDRWWVILGALLAAAVLAGVAVVLSGRREFGAGLVRRRDTRGSRLRLRTAAGLAARLARGRLLSWTVVVAAIGALFSAMGSGSVEQSRDGDLGGFLGTQLGAGDPVAGYLAYCGTVIGIVVSVFAVLSVTAGGQSERAGLTDVVLASGVRRWAPLAAQAGVTAAGCAVILAATAALSALIAPLVIDGQDVASRSLAYVAGQWPAAVAMTGCTTLVVGLRPRLAGLAWLPLAASALVALLGDLLSIPQRVQDLGLFRHVPDIAAPSPHTGALLLLVAAGAVLGVLGVAATTRRDITTG